MLLRSFLGVVLIDLIVVLFGVYCGGQCEWFVCLCGVV